MENVVVLKVNAFPAKKCFPFPNPRFTKQLPISPMEALCNPGSRKAPENLVIRSLVRFNPRPKFEQNPEAVQTRGC